MNYYEQDDRKRRVWAIVGVAAYLAVCVGVMFIHYKISLPQPELGIVVDFGMSDTGLGEEDLAAGDVDVSPAAPQPPSPAEPVITTEDENAPVEVPKPEPEPRPQPPAPEPAPARQPNRQALFPGRTEGSAATSQGTAGGEGNQGTNEGAPEGSATAGGSGSSGFSLDGRYMVGNLPRPDYNVDVEGRVVINITVDAQGKVTRAVYQQAGSTTNNGALVDAARTAAAKARFTPSEAEVQTGTITYIFRLN